MILRSYLQIQALGPPEAKRIKSSKRTASPRQSEYSRLAASVAIGKQRCVRHSPYFEFSVSDRLLFSSAMGHAQRAPAVSPAVSNANILPKER